MFVIKFNYWLYWCKNNTVSPQIEKAIIYNDIKHASKVADRCMQKRTELKNGFEDIYCAEIKQIEIREI